MKKHPRHPEVSARSSSSPDPDTTAQVVPVRPPGRAYGVEPDKLKSVADSELDLPEEGLDPTLPGNLVHGLPGHKIKEPPSEDEDDEGRSLAEQLFEEGVEEAEQDKVNRAVRASMRSNRREQ